MNYSCDCFFYGPSYLPLSTNISPSQWYKLQYYKCYWRVFYIGDELLKDCFDMSNKYMMSVAGNRTLGSRQLPMVLRPRTIHTSYHSIHPTTDYVELKGSKPDGHSSTLYSDRHRPDHMPPWAVSTLTVLCRITTTRQGPYHRNSSCAVSL